MKLNKIILSLGLSSILFTNANAYSWNPAAQIAADEVSNAAQWGVEVSFYESLEEYWNQFSLQNSILSGKITADSNKAYDQVMGKASEIGGAYSGELAGIMDSCFNFKLPDFSAGLGLDGLDFCGIGDVNSILKKVTKSKSDNVKGTDKNKVSEPKVAPVGTPPDPKTDSSKNNCNPDTDPGCKESQQKIVEKLDKNGRDSAGSVPTSYSKPKASQAYFSNAPLATDNQLNDGSAETQSQLKHIVDDMGEVTKSNGELLSDSSPLLDLSQPEDVKVNMVKNNDKKSEMANDRINENLDNRDTFNMYYRPDTLVLKDPALLDNSWYSRNTSDLGNYPVKYIVPSVKDDEAGKQFNITPYSLDNYRAGADEITKIEGIETVIKNSGGITPFTSSYAGYIAAKDVMAENIAKNGEDQGSLGRETAMINGLKGIMYQMMLTNKNIEDFSNVTYEINKRNQTKISADNDELKYQLSQMQQQNMMIIIQLKEIAGYLKTISQK